MHSGIVMVSALLGAAQTYKLENSRVALGLAAGTEVLCRLAWTLPKAVHKAGVIGLTKAMAHELAPDITVNCVSPGLIETERRGETAKRPHHHATRTNLAGRRGLPEEVAAAVRGVESAQETQQSVMTQPVAGGKNFLRCNWGHFRTASIPRCTQAKNVDFATPARSRIS